MPIPYLPPEILDYIVDFLHDEPETLEECCLVSKSWVPRARSHLFADIKIRPESDLKLWKKQLAGAGNTLAYHTRTLSIGCPEFVVDADAGEGGWIRAFSSVESLDVNNGVWPLDTLRCTITPFHGFSSTLKSFRVCPIILPSPQLFFLIRSSPLLEDLTVVGHSESSGEDNNPHWLPPGVSTTSPPLSGSLDLNIPGGMGNTVCRLLDLPNGLHFRKLVFSWDLREDLRWITELVEECSHTLEFLHIACDSRGTSSRHPHPHPYQRLTPTPSWVGFNFNQPLKGHETQRCNFSVRIAGRQLDYRGTPNHHTPTSTSSTNIHLFTFPLDLLRRRHKYGASHWRSGRQTVAGP